MRRWKHFSDAEVAGLDVRLVELLDDAREECGFAFKLTETVAKGGSHVKDSAHASGLAVDIGCSTSNRRFKLILALYKLGIRRMGVYDRHIHIDIDEDKPQNVLWWGKSS